MIEAGEKLPSQGIVRRLADRLSGVEGREPAGDDDDTAARPGIVCAGQAVLEEVPVAIGLGDGAAEDPRVSEAVEAEFDVGREREVVQLEGIVGPDVIHVVGDRRVAGQRIQGGAVLVREEMGVTEIERVLAETERATHGRGGIGARLCGKCGCLQICDAEEAAHRLVSPVQRGLD